MEPLSSAAIAISSLIFTKAFEKTGEKLGESFSNRIGKFAELLKGRVLPKTQAIEAGTIKTDYNAAVQELEVVIESDAELSSVVGELSQIVESDPILYEKALSTAALVESEPTIIQNHNKLAEKIGLVVQGGEVNIKNFSF